MNVIEHYDRLIDEENDPVRDVPALKAYMDRWDGADFLDAMELSKSKRVLEIGVGTGRLAVRVIPACREFVGIDLSPKTIARAEENLSGMGEFSLVCGDFLTWETKKRFDVIYSSLTFLHLEDKRRAFFKAEELLLPGGRLVLSIDKNPAEWLDFETRRLRVFPDHPDVTASRIEGAGLKLLRRWETEVAVIFVAKKERQDED